MSAQRWYTVGLAATTGKATALRDAYLQGHPGARLRTRRRWVGRRSRAAWQQLRQVAGRFISPQDRPAYDAALDAIRATYTFYDMQALRRSGEATACQP